MCRRGPDKYAAMKPPPNLSDPAERAAYRRELVAYARPLRILGLALLLGGGVMVAWPRLSGQWVMVGDHSLQSLGWFVVATGFVVVIAVIFLRTRRHRLRMRGEA